MKIGTLKVCSDFEGNRLGEGAIGIALWLWQASSFDQIYATVFEKHTDTIDMLNIYGFEFKTKNERGEHVFVKDKRFIKYDTVLKAFPFVNPDFKRGKIIPIDSQYHDEMFQWSELNGIVQKKGTLPVSNGIKKVFIATPAEWIDYRPEDLILIYRKSPDNGRYKSVITSFCTIINQYWIKIEGEEKYTYDDFKKLVGNKTVYNESQLREAYSRRFVLYMELAYNGYLGKGNNVNYDWLNSQGYFTNHPYKITLEKEKVLDILERGGKNEDDIAVDKSRTC